MLHGILLLEIDDFWFGVIAAERPYSPVSSCVNFELLELEGRTVVSDLKRRSADSAIRPVRRRYRYAMRDRHPEQKTASDWRAEIFPTRARLHTRAAPRLLRRRKTRVRPPRQSTKNLR